MRARTWPAWSWSRSWPSSPSALGWLIAGRVLRPLRTITATARDISARNLNQRLALDRPATTSSPQLGETLDGLFGRLEASFQAQRHFVANASHELRTPLTAERTLLQVALADPDATAQTLRSACEKALQWASSRNASSTRCSPWPAASAGSSSWEPFDLADIAGKAILDRHQEAERRGIRIDADLSRGPGHRRPGPGREPGGEPGRQRHPAQPATAAGSRSPRP